MDVDANDGKTARNFYFSSKKQNFHHMCTPYLTSNQGICFYEEEKLILEIFSNKCMIIKRNGTNKMYPVYLTLASGLKTLC